MPSTLDEQIQSLKHRGISFNLKNEEEVRQFLTDNSYFYKITAYRHNYSRRFDSQTNMEVYDGLDFGYLIELSNIDFALSRLILSLALGVEHSLKVRMNKLLMNDEKASDHAQFAIRRASSQDSVKPKSNYYTDDLLKHCGTKPNLWQLWELLSFSDQIKLYTEYCDITGERNRHKHFLTVVRIVRNAVSHGSCLLYDVTKQIPRKVNKGQPDLEVIDESLSMCDRGKRKHGKRNSTLVEALNRLVVHNYATVLLCHLEFVNSSKVLYYSTLEVEDFINRVERNRGAYFGQDGVRSERNREVNVTLESLVVLSRGYIKKARKKAEYLEKKNGTLPNSSVYLLSEWGYL